MGSGKDETGFTSSLFAESRLPTRKNGGLSCGCASNRDLMVNSLWIALMEE